MGWVEVQQVVGGGRVYISACAGGITATQYTTVFPPTHALIYTLPAPYRHTTSYWLYHFLAATQLGINTPHNPSTDILHSLAYEDGTDSEF